MRTKLALLSLTLALVLSGHGITRADDDKKTDKPDATKDDGKPCPGPRTDSCPKDGCCDGEKKDTAKKGEAKKADDCPCCKPAQSGCPECAKAKDGCCKQCEEKIASGVAYVLPVKGMMCGACEGKVTEAVKGIAGISWAAASAQKNAAILSVAPGKTVKLSEVETALEKAEFSLDDSAPIKGRVTLTIDGPRCDGCAKAVCNALTQLKGLDASSCTSCSADASTRTGTFTIALGVKSEVSLKQLRDAVATTKFKLSEVVFSGPKEDASKKS